MSSPVVRLRDMRQDEYTAEREADYLAAMAGVLPSEVARDRARQGTAEFLPQGLATARHRLLMAENAAGEVVGAAWLGLSPAAARPSWPDCTTSGSPSRTAAPATGARSCPRQSRWPARRARRGSGSTCSATTSPPSPSTSPPGTR